MKELQHKQEERLFPGSIPGLVLPQKRTEKLKGGIFMKKFELFICSLGNGLTICNKAVMENGDYKHIAHIANCGKITWYVEPSKIPGDALLRIEHDADAMHANFEKWLDSMPKSMQYEKLVDMVPLNIFLYVSNLGGGIERKIEYLKNVIYQKATF